MGAKIKFVQEVLRRQESQNIYHPPLGYTFEKK